MQALRMCGMGKASLTCKTLLQPYTTVSLRFTSRLLHPRRRNVGDRAWRSQSIVIPHPVVSRCFHTSRPLQLTLSPLDPALGGFVVKILLFFWKRQLRLYFADRPELTNKFYRIMQNLFIVLFACAIAQYIYYRVKIPLIERRRYINPWADIPSYNNMMMFKYMNFKTVPYRHHASLYVHHHFKNLLNANADIPWIKENVSLGTLQLVNQEMDLIAATINNKIYITQQQMRKFGNDDEVAGSLAHELAHLTLRHNEWLGSVYMFQAGLGYLASAAAWLCLQNEIASFLVDLGITLVNMIQVQKILRITTTEMEADKYGMIFAAKACYDPIGLKHALARGGNEGMEGSNISVWQFWPLKNHPTLYERYKVIDANIEKALDIRQKSGCRSSKSSNKQFILLADMLNMNMNNNKLNLKNSNENGTSCDVNGTCSDVSIICSKEKCTYSQEKRTSSSENEKCNKENKQCINENDKCSKEDGECCS